MAIKLLGCFIYVSMMILLGFIESKRLRKRTEQMKDMIISLQILETEMDYSEQRLQLIFSSISEKTTGPIALFYGSLARKLQKVVTDFNKIWNDGLEELEEMTALKQNEMTILQQFGQNLGHHSLKQQKKHIALTIYYLQKELDDAKSRQQQYGKPIIMLTSLLGVFIVIILF